MPDPGDWERKKARKKGKAASPSSSMPGTVPAQPAGTNPWESAAATLKAQQQTTPTPSAPASKAEPATPWATVDEKSSTAALRKLGRGVLWGVVGLAVITGVRSWIIPNQSDAPPPAAVKTAPAYPSDAAQAAAARFARAYLTWNEDDQDARAAALAALLPKDSDTDAGWDGRGRQDVLTVQPGAVTPTTQGQARVRVDVLLHTTEEAGTPAEGKKKATPAKTADRWIGLEVPVVHTAGQVVVTGAPGMVGLPASGPTLPDLKAPESDATFAQQTEGTVSAFFKAYAGGDTGAVTAPGATIPPVPAGMTLVGVTSWAADAGTGTDRTGTARVMWKVGEAQIEQTYQVELTRVASADAERWQVVDVHGGAA
ncbi:conjugal transfer protein [Streptomyces sp. NBC_00691]|uniref:conjugal transfer protein n=1 Tax=Streptomyces sp. NBC_00691 TaxID=2903671 RepID=UPI002E34C17D|nr:conjugal transfer protein [Streptomyces sp. NBC_00691]